MPDDSVKHLARSAAGFSQQKALLSDAEMTPGPIAINAATFVGIRVAGIPGALVATLGCVLPSCIIVISLAYVYYRFRCRYIEQENELLVV